MNKDENTSDIEIIQYYNIQEEELYKNNNTMPSSAYAVIEVQGKFLIGYNSYREQWEFPAGKIESGETAMEAARRELYEETHQIVDELEFCGLFKIYDKTKKEYRFRAVYKGEAESLTEFVPWENDEMLGIRLWDFGDPSISVDPVDTKMVEMLMRKITYEKLEIDITKSQEEKVYEEKLYYDLYDLCASLFVQFKRIK